MVKMEDVIEVEMPVGAEIIYFDMQAFEPSVRPCIWARVNSEAPKEIRKFRFAGTGHPLEENVGRHIGSCQMFEGKLVWHLFEMEE